LKRKRDSIVLTKLVDESANELRIMTIELQTGKAEKVSEVRGPLSWGRRFAASGKRDFAPKARAR
jgi:hypothetical protein